MKLKTTVNVTGQNLYDEVAVGKMLAFEPLENGGLRFSAEYRKEDGTPVKSVSKTYTAEQVQTLFEAIQGDLTPGLNGVLAIWEQVYKAFAIEMATTFGITLAEIELVED